MKAIILGVAMGALVVSALPASAEVVVRGTHRGVVVKEVHRPHHYYHHCRTVKVKTRLPNGDVIIKTRRRC
jgi:hypothetical protein